MKHPEPLLQVMGGVKEHMEGVKAGMAQLFSIDRKGIVSGSCHLLNHAMAFAEVAKVLNRFGDGDTAEQGVRVIKGWQDV